MLEITHQDLSVMNLMYYLMNMKLVQKAVTEPDDLDILHACISISITLESPITLRLEVPAPIILNVIVFDWLLAVLSSIKLTIAVPELLELPLNA